MNKTPFCAIWVVQKKAPRCPSSINMVFFCLDEPKQFQPICSANLGIIEVKFDTDIQTARLILDARYVSMWYYFSSLNFKQFQIFVPVLGMMLLIVHIILFSALKSNGQMTLFRFPNIFTNLSFSLIQNLWDPDLIGINKKWWHLAGFAQPTSRSGLAT